MNTAKRTLLSAAIFAAAISAFAQGPITFKGSVIPLADQHGRASISLSVDGVQQELRVKNNGHFRFTVEAGEQVRMISSCEGFVQKEVVIDAAHAGANQHTVKFDVELQKQNASCDLYHKDPAGNLAFAEGTGRLVVAYGDRSVQQESKVLAARQ